MKSEKLENLSRSYNHPDFFCDVFRFTGRHQDCCIDDNMPRYCPCLNDFISSCDSEIDYGYHVDYLKYCTGK